MFHNLTLHGGTGAVLYHYHTAAVLTAWRIAKRQNQWHLSATVSRADRFQCGQKGLHFTAPRDHQGFWCWEIQSLELVGNQIRVLLGAPLQ